jgi:hypothetical protein
LFSWGWNAKISSDGYNIGERKKEKKKKDGRDQISNSVRHTHNLESGGRRTEKKTDLCVRIVCGLETEILDPHFLEEHPHET